MSRHPGSIALLVILALQTASPQGGGEFDVNAYRRFLDSHRNLGSAELQAMHPAGYFCATSPLPVPDPAYLASICTAYELTAYEKDLLARHGFVVTSRLGRPSMISAFADVYNRDLPVFISTDAILEAIHYSYDRILRDIEKAMLLPELQQVLLSLHGQLPLLDQRYGLEPAMKSMLRDLDIYLTVPLRLLGQGTSTYYVEDNSAVDDLLARIAAQLPADVVLFAETRRTMDFSQFTVRGHYTQDSLLSRYFRAMIWLGRTELYLIPPGGTTTAWPFKDIQRQIVDAALVAEAVRGSNTRPSLAKIDSVIGFMVGEQDNVRFDQLDATLADVAVHSADQFLDTATVQAFQDSLASKSFAFQRINSQILMTDPCDPTRVRPASAFLLMGQRFVIDSYVAGNVVYDKITFDGEKVPRMLPSTLDVLFSLGNDAAAQLLKSELEEYKYSTNLAALRYLVDSYNGDFWNGSLFNCWLSILRTINPPSDRTPLPGFMQTAAWWQEKMNTQLASWAQLRHDNLLYAKQSYTPGVICSFPDSWVEPFPAFYDRVKAFAAIAAAQFGRMGLPDIESYFDGIIGIVDTLGNIARKELAGTSLLAPERGFLSHMLYREAMCGSPYEGWYPQLFYGFWSLIGGAESVADMVVADVHTAPTDAAGNLVGWVLHVGTGPVDLAIVAVPTPGGGAGTFVGPVLSYYEHLATGFERLTDEEWKTAYNIAPSLRPGFVNIYLADENGGSRGTGPSLLTGVEPGPGGRQADQFILLQNFPNPFNPSTFIPIAVPYLSGGQRVTLEIHDLHGRLIAKLVDQVLTGGNYIVRWDGRTSGRTLASTGVYFCRLRCGNASLCRKMLLMR